VIFRQPDTGFGNFASISSNFEIRQEKPRSRQYEIQLESTTTSGTGGAYFVVVFESDARFANFASLNSKATKKDEDDLLNIKISRSRAISNITRSSLRGMLNITRSGATALGLREQEGGCFAVFFESNARFASFEGISSQSTKSDQDNI
jgi:hypothetical protein